MKKTQLRKLIKEMVQDIQEEDINSESEFKDYAINLLKKAHDDYDQAIADKTIDGIIDKTDGDWGAAIGMIQNSLSEGNQVSADVRRGLALNLNK